MAGASNDNKKPKDRRAERLAAALRDNLRRRKTQARNRAEAEDKSMPEADTQSPALDKSRQ